MASHHRINSNDINSADNNDSHSGNYNNGRGERRNFMSQVNKLGSSRQTMATDMTSSLFSSNTPNHGHNNNNMNSNSPSHGHARNNQMRNSYNSRGSRDYQQHLYPSAGSSSGLHEERELQRRRAEDNAAWVKMLEGEAQLLQGASKTEGEATPSIPSSSHHGDSRSRSNSPSINGPTNISNARKSSSKGKMRRCRSEGLDPHFLDAGGGDNGGSFHNHSMQRHGGQQGPMGGGHRDSYRRGLYNAQHNMSQNSALSGRSGSRRSGRSSLQHHHQPSHQSHQQPYTPYHRYNTTDDGQQQQQQYHQQQQQQQQHHSFQRDIPLELDIPSRPNADGRGHDFLAGGGGGRSSHSVHSRGSITHSVHSRGSHQRHNTCRQHHQQSHQQHHHHGNVQNHPRQSSSSFVPPVNPLMEHSDRQEFEIDLNTPLNNNYDRGDINNRSNGNIDMDEMMRKNHGRNISLSGEDWRSSPQPRRPTSSGQPRERAMSTPCLEFNNSRAYADNNANMNGNGRRHSPLPPPEEKDEHRSRGRGEDLPIPPPSRKMSLVQAIHNLELENGVDRGNSDQHLPLPPPAARSYRDRDILQKDFDDILVGDGNRHQHQHHSHRSGNDHDRHYRSQQQQQQPPIDVVLDNYQSRDRDREQRGRHHQPPMPPHQSHDEPPQRLKGPIETLEFPTNWDGAEIEATLDDELLDRDEDEYYRRRSEYLQHQQQHSQNSQFSPPHSQPRQQRSPSQQQHSPQQSRSRQPIRRLLSTDSNFGGAGGFASDLYSQNIAVSGHRVAPMQIEVSPGVSMPFRGSEETWEAIAMNRIVKTECLGCSIQLYCVEDAELVVCPDCQTMSPAHELGSGEDPNRDRRSGLGLGFKEEQLVQWRHA